MQRRPLCLGLVLSAGFIYGAIAQDPAGITRNMEKQRVLLHHESTRFPFVVISENVRALDGAWVKALETYVIRPDRLECVQPDRHIVMVQTDTGALSIDCTD